MLYIIIIYLFMKGTILKRISAPQPADLMKAISNETKKALESVSERFFL
jgi:hypothetical protein